MRESCKGYRRTKGIAMQATTYTSYDSPVGPLLLIMRGGELIGLYFAKQGQPCPPPTDAVEDAAGFGQVMRQLDAYFAGELTQFDLPIHPTGTAFQERVWQELLKIPYRQTISYGELARRVGNPKASRAVGAANGKNPISIIIPCHRVIGASGKLTGFGGGIDTKQRLLELEAHQTSLFAEAE